MGFLLVHDLGTSSAKAALFDTDGKLVRSNSVAYATYRPAPGLAEQDPADWERAFCENNRILLNGIDQKQVLACGIDGTQPTCICLDENGRALRKAIIWQDNRAVEEAKLVAATLKPKLLEQIGVVSPSRGICALMWVRKHEPEVFEQTARFCCSNSNYLLSRLTGKVMCDHDSAFSMATANRKTGWLYEITDAMNLSRSLLPELHQSPEVVGAVSAEAAKEFCLPEGLKLVILPSDGMCGNVALNLRKPGQCSLIAGTSGGMSAVGVDGDFIRTRGTSSTGASMEWMKHTFCFEERREAEATGRDVFDLICEKVASAPIGCHGAMFLPYLGGERGKRENEEARGSFTGLSLATTREDMMRAVVEGNGLNLNLYLEGYHKAGVWPASAIFTGGLSKSPVIRQIFADITGLELITLKNASYVCCMGAAVLTGMAIGLYQDEEAAELFKQQGTITRPIPENVKEYRKLVPLFDEVYEAQLLLYSKMNYDF